MAFRLLDPRRLDASFDAFLVAASRVVGTSRAQAAEAGVDYLAALGVTVPDEGITPAPLVAAAWRASMHVLTVATAKRATADGLTLPVALALAQRRSQGSAARRMLDAQRSVVAQGSVLGWQRVSAGVPDCDFCGDLIREGVKDDDSFPSHDHCDCMVEPVLERTR